jgi:hypothetical protein
MNATRLDRSRDVPHAGREARAALSAADRARWDRSKEGVGPFFRSTKNSPALRADRTSDRFLPDMCGSRGKRCARGRGRGHKKGPVEETSVRIVACVSGKGTCGLPSLAVAFCTAEVIACKDLAAASGIATFTQRFASKRHGNSTIQWCANLRRAVSLASVAISVLGNRTQERLLAASVWPYVSFSSGIHQRRWPEANHRALALVRTRAVDRRRIKEFSLGYDHQKVTSRPRADGALLRPFP